MDRSVGGRANTVLVCGEGESAVGVLSSITATVDEPRQRKRVMYVGKVAFDRATARHISRVVVPIVDTICTVLGLPRMHFTVSAVNVGAASMNDIGTRISGLSADVPVFLAMLSAVLKMPLPSDVVTSGHLASRDGDIRMVRHLGVKAQTAILDPSIRTFIYPAIDADISVRQIAPVEREKAAAEIAKAKLDVSVVPVRDVRDLLRAVFNDEAVVKGALTAGFYGREPVAVAGPVGLLAAAVSLLEDDEDRFMATLERRLLSGDAQRVHDLLDLWVRFHAGKGRYPAGFGGKLRNLVSGLPPAVRRLKIKRLLLDPSQCRQLSLLATEADFEDLKYLYEGNPGPHKIVHREPAEVAGSTTDSTGTDERSLDAILTEVEPERLAEIVGVPIDGARASYVMDSVMVSGHDEFMDMISAFYLHLLRRTGTVTGPVESADVGPEANTLLERAFAKNGGLAGALSEAMTGTHGGMRHVLDVLTEQHKTEQQEKYVLSVFKEAIDPLDWDGRVRLMRAFLSRHGTDLPSEITAEPPERYARNFEHILRTYVRSISQLKQLLRAL